MRISFRSIVAALALTSFTVGVLADDTTAASAASTNKAPAAPARKQTVQSKGATKPTVKKVEPKPEPPKAPGGVKIVEIVEPNGKVRYVSK